MLSIQITATLTRSLDGMPASAAAVHGSSVGTDVSAERGGKSVCLESRKRYFTYQLVHSYTNWLFAGESWRRVKFTCARWKNPCYLKIRLMELIWVLNCWSEMSNETLPESFGSIRVVYQSLWRKIVRISKKQGNLEEDCWLARVTGFYLVQWKR